MRATFSGTRNVVIVDGELMMVGHVKISPANTGIADKVSQIVGGQIGSP